MAKITAKFLPVTAHHHGCTGISKRAICLLLYCRTVAALLFTLRAALWSRENNCLAKTFWERGNLNYCVLTEVRYVPQLMYGSSCQQIDGFRFNWQVSKTGTEALKCSQEGKRAGGARHSLPAQTWGRHFKLHKHFTPTQHRRNMYNRRKQWHSDSVDEKFCWNYPNRIRSRQDKVNNRRWTQKICSSARQENLAEQSKKQSKPWDTTVASYLHTTEDKFVSKVKDSSSLPMHIEH